MSKQVNLCRKLCINPKDYHGLVIPSLGSGFLQFDMQKLPADRLDVIGPIHRFFRKEQPSTSDVYIDYIAKEVCLFLGTDAHGFGVYLVIGSFKAVGVIKYGVITPGKIIWRALPH